MTRFARAKGSKACNEKTPEEPTSWLEMKKAILSKPSTPVTTVPKESVVNKTQSDKSKTATEWASLDNDTIGEQFNIIREHMRKKQANNTNDTSSSSPKKKKRIKQVQSSNEDNNEMAYETAKAGKKKSKQAAMLKEVNGISDVSNSDNLQSININKDNKMKGLKRKSKEITLEEPLKKKKAKMNSGNEIQVDKIRKKKEKFQKKSKVSLNNNNCQNGETSKEVNLKDKPEEDTNSHGRKNKKQKQKKLKNKTLKQSRSIENESQENSTSQKKFKKFNSVSNGLNHTKNKQFKNSKDFRQHKNDNYNKSKFNSDRQNIVEELIVNGEKIKVVKFQGFNVTLDDAERLKKLRQDMFKEGIPRDKLEAAIKLERRRAEKALSRLKKAVCFHCRGFGHVLSQCPTLTENQNTGTGICYKCGSTEHSSNECKVVRGSSFQFAECFICKEQGHIARQCPDNPRGLYPHGGACKECGDVTHLRKDCPANATKKEDNIMTIGVRNDRNVESLDDDMGIGARKGNEVKSVPKKSVVKF